MGLSQSYDMGRELGQLTRVFFVLFLVDLFFNFILQY
jgi:hypothetical protein